MRKECCLGEEWPEGSFIHKKYFAVARSFYEHTGTSFRYGEIEGLKKKVKSGDIQPCRIGSEKNTILAYRLCVDRFCSHKGAHQILIKLSVDSSNGYFIGLAPLRPKGVKAGARPGRRDKVKKVGRTRSDTRGILGQWEEDLA